MHTISTQGLSVIANAHSSADKLTQKIARTESQPQDTAQPKRLLNPTTDISSTVSISPQARALQATEQSKVYSKVQSTSNVDINAKASAENSIETTKPVPIKYNEKLDNYVQFKKAQMKYQIYADMINISSGNSGSIKPATAYYLSNNEDARAFTVNSMTRNHQVAMLNTYAETTKSAQNQFINTKT
ncbi:hypothetical protein [Shewanella subflava]|uniref:Uncharacterized protein n=1 Tax=Shewanella subflava TaxID=2986476 RepID=A0ABT3I4U6_9GAMM|nr:hypothetical protein [Shewanella subflava]MCW3171091.1 hypothetical protein [Shewanella subflava]